MWNNNIKSIIKLLYFIVWLNFPILCMKVMAFKMVIYQFRYQHHQHMLCNDTLQGSDCMAGNGREVILCDCYLMLC